MYAFYSLHFKLENVPGLWIQTIASNKWGGSSCVKKRLEKGVRRVQRKGELAEDNREVRNFFLFFNIRSVTSFDQKNILYLHQTFSIIMLHQDLFRIVEGNKLAENSYQMLRVCNWQWQPPCPCSLVHEPAIRWLILSGNCPRERRQELGMIWAMRWTPGKSIGEFH